MTVKKGCHVAAIFCVLLDSFCDGVVDNGVVYRIILMHKPISKPGALGDSKGEFSGKNPRLSRFHKGIMGILRGGVRQLDGEMSVDVHRCVHKQL